jgi:uncharacterized repeat protein (TIGR01451 family)
MNTKKIILFLLLIFSAGVLMAQPLSISKSVTQMSCNTTGSASVTASGGLPPYTYEWRLNQGPVFSNSPSVSGLGAGYYSITVTDANNDIEMDSVTMSNGIDANFSNFGKAVCPLSNGFATVIVEGGSTPYTYLWSNGSSTNTATGLAGGSTVQVQVMDANGCYANFYSSSSVLGTTVGELAIGTTSTINVNYSSVPEQCPLNNGSITLSTSGGTPPYTYYWNTSPVKNTSTITGLPAGSYTGTVRDADGCATEVYAIVNVNPGSLNVTATKVNDYCSKLQGSATLTITGGVSPYTVQWPDGSSALTKSGLGYGFHTAIVTDQNNCVFHRQIFIEDISPVSTWITPVETACDNISGSALANVTGGVAPYSYLWNNGGTSASIQNLSKGCYSVQVTDANGCKGRDWASVEINNSCYGYISGKIYQDNNGNCVQDIGDYVIMNDWAQMAANASPRSLYDGYSCTGISGKYSMRYVLPDQYTVNFHDIATRTAACPSTGKHNISISTSGVNYPGYDFAMQPSSLDEDVSLRYYGCMMSEPRPGFDYSYVFSYKNTGTLPSDGFIEVVYSDYETFLSSSPAADYYDPLTKTLRFNYSSLMLGEIRSIRLNFNTPVATLLGTTYNHIITADVGATDPTPNDNELIYHFTVVGSFDPNDLAVYPKGALAEEDSVLTYTIRFQNTGTYYAELVVIKDTLEANLDIRSVKDITASHTFTFRQLENRAIEFAFPNINLPDSNRNEPESHGFVTFNIKRTKNLSPGTLIRNRAEIYFDFNAPIVTNTTTNNIPLTAGIEGKSTASSGKVYPNPAKDYTAFSFEKEIAKIQLMNASGRVVMTQLVHNEKEFSLNFNLSKGMYFYTANTQDGNGYSGKLIVE